MLGDSTSPVYSEPKANDDWWYGHIPYLSTFILIYLLLISVAMSF